MKITTTIEIPAAPEAVWPLLYGSKMTIKAPLLLRLVGIEPKACRLVEGRGEGARRQCLTGDGAMNQRITEWKENEVLAFRMESETVGLKWVEALDDRFTLERTGEGTRLTRTTNVKLAGMCRPFKALAIFVTLKKIHRYVFENWSAEASVSPVEAGSLRR
ncbi:MAG: SRPBCC family protein [Planctomycetota bacterium]